jgi:hypothetical protein
MSPAENAGINQKIAKDNRVPLNIPILKKPG